jgi:hypothetical protein
MSPKRSDETEILINALNNKSSLHNNKYNNIIHDVFTRVRT